MQRVIVQARDAGNTAIPGTHRIESLSRIERPAWSSRVKSEASISSFLTDTGHHTAAPPRVFDRSRRGRRSRPCSNTRSCGPVAPTRRHRGVGASGHLPLTHQWPQRSLTPTRPVFPPFRTLNRSRDQYHQFRLTHAMNQTSILAVLNI